MGQTSLSKFVNLCPQQEFTLPIAIGEAKKFVDTFKRPNEGLMHDAKDFETHAMVPDLAELNHL
jgi:hypothetical protein